MGTLLVGTARAVGAMALEVLAKLHGDLFRSLTDVLGDAEGLSVVARRGRKRGFLTNQTLKKIVRVDEAFAMMRHANNARADKLRDLVSGELSVAVFRVIECGSAVLGEGCTTHAVGYAEMTGVSQPFENGDNNGAHCSHGPFHTASTAGHHNFPVIVSSQVNSASTADCQHPPLLPELSAASLTGAQFYIGEELVNKAIQTEDCVVHDGCDERVMVEHPSVPVDLCGPNTSQASGEEKLGIQTKKRRVELNLINQQELQDIEASRTAQHQARLESAREVRRRMTSDEPLPQTGFIAKVREKLHACPLSAVCLDVDAHESEDPEVDTVSRAHGESSKGFCIAPISQRGMAGASAKEARPHGPGTKSRGGSSHSQVHALRKTDGRYKPI